MSPTGTSLADASDDGRRPAVERTLVELDLRLLEHLRVDFAATILPLATAYYVCEAFGWESGIDKKWGEAKQFYSLYTGIVVLGAAVVLIPNLPLIKVMLISPVVNGMLLPFILIFMLLLVNNVRIMGKHTNGPIFNAIAWVTTIVMIVLTGYLVVDGVRNLAGA